MYYDVISTLTYRYQVLWHTLLPTFDWVYYYLAHAHLNIWLVHTNILHTPLPIFIGLIMSCHVMSCHITVISCIQLLSSHICHLNLDVPLSGPCGLFVDGEISLHLQDQIVVFDDSKVKTTTTFPGFTFTLPSCLYLFTHQPLMPYPLNLKPFFNLSCSVSHNVLLRTSCNLFSPSHIMSRSLCLVS